MKRFTLAAFVFLIPLASFAENVQRYIVVTHQPFRRAIVDLRDETPESIGRDVASFESVNGYEATLSDSQVAALRRSRSVAYVEPVLERHALGRITSLADEVKNGSQTVPYGVTMVHAPEVWAATKGKSIDPSRPTHVVIVDSGIGYDDPELAAAYKGGHNFIDGTDNPMDDNGHGSHVAGTIAAADNNAGVVGIAPEVEVYSLKVLDTCGSGSTSDIIHAMDWVLAEKNAIGGNWIVNMSLGAPQPSTAERTSIQGAIDAGILICAAAGNSYTTTQVDGLSYPAAYPGVVSVGAIDSTQTIADFSQRGPDLKVVGPGVGVLSTIVTEQVATGNQAYDATLPVAKGSFGADICLTPPVMSGTIVDCKQGHTGEFPADVAGNIALIERGDITFAAKAKNAKAAGATGVIVYNSDGGTALVPDLGTLTSATAVPPFVFIARPDGLALKAMGNPTVSLSFGKHSFALYQGTSMATPHVTGAAALVWSVAPSASATQVALAIEQTATDLGASGFDTVYGNGLVNALAAAKQLNPALFSTPAQPAPQPLPGRLPGRRGH